MTAKIHFVTGRLAEHSLREVLAELAPRADFDYSIDVLPITVAALMTPQWIASRIRVPPDADRVLIPGYCGGDLGPIEAACHVPIERGPRDLRQLPAYFGAAANREGYGAHAIEIVAEINHAPRLALATLLAEADQLRRAGANIIDVGCDPHGTWGQVGDAVRALRDAGHRVSVDSLNIREIELAVAAGAELVLSVNSTNREAAADWGCEVVAIPDTPAGLVGLDATVEHLASRGVRLRIDPILEPIGFGFAASLARYMEIRRRYPDAEMLMGIGNLTELAECDSAGINLLLLGICEELSIHSVLTTQVIPWAQSSVAECDVARRLVHYAVQKRTLPKHVDPRLVMLRDADPVGPSAADIEALAPQIKDNNFRIYRVGDEFHLLAADLHLVDSDPFHLFDRLLAQQPPVKHLDPSHAFYLGYEFSKAVTAATLGKRYEQDEALDWGLLTREEKRHRL